MASDASILSSELLDDFYAECEEHLVAIRNSLAALQAGLDHGATDAPAIEKLFRSVHSLKGICGIVGLRAAEQLAHAAEDYLRAVTSAPGSLNRAGLDALSDAAHKLEQVIAAHRAGHATPATAGQIAALAALTSSSPATPERITPAAPASSQKDLTRQRDEVLAAGGTVWQCTFTPSAVLDQRGINVNEIRNRLGGVGKILRASPLVHGGNIAFEFIVATKEQQVEWSGWADDGVAVAPFSEERHQPAAAPASTTADAAAHTPFLAPSHVVRVDLARLDELMRIAGEMVVRRARMEEQIGRLAKKHREVDCTPLEEATVALSRDLRDLREAIMRVRLVPAAEIFSRMPFVVRDIARDSGKDVRVVVSGQETQLDKYVVERLKDPLLHMVRNAVSHGIEMPAERLAAGKPGEATISLAAATAGDVVVIRIADDGRGIDARQVAERAAALNIAVPQQLDDAGILELISSPGFSTRKEADLASGRGVGMAVVATTVRELGGTIVMESDPGRGTTFTLRLPLTLAIVDALIVTAGGQTFAFPQPNIEQIIQIDPGAVRRIGRAEMIQHRGAALPLIRVNSRFRLPAPAADRGAVLVVSTDRGPVGLAVDRVFDQREVVVRALQDPLVQVSGFSGATDLGDGKPVLIVDALALARGDAAATPARTGAFL